MGTVQMFNSYWDQISSKSKIIDFDYDTQKYVTKMSKIYNEKLNAQYKIEESTIANYSDFKSYFEKADFSSDFPLQVLTVALGLILVLLELSLAQWPLFYGAAPNLSLIFIYYMMIYHTKLLPIFSIFMMGIVGDFLLSDLLGGRATALILLVYVMQLRLLRLQQSDFSHLWVDFAVSCSLVSIFQLTFFSMLNLTTY